MSSPRCLPSIAASRPIGPAPVTRTVRGSQSAHWPTAAICSHGLVTTAVGSSSTPRSPRDTVSPHRVLRLDSPVLRHEPINLFDTALSVLAVAAHVPFTYGAVWARNGVGTSDNADHQITLLEPAGWVRFQDAAEGFVAKYEACLAWGRHPYFPSIISTSVPQTPTAMASTSTEPSRTSGSWTSSHLAVAGFFGSTVIARIYMTSFSVRSCVGFALLEAWFTGVQKLLRIHTAKKFDQHHNQTGPSGLMAGSQASAVITVEVLVEQDAVLPMGVALEPLCASKHRTPP